MTRYVLMKLGDDYKIDDKKSSTQINNEWVAKFDETAVYVTKNIEQYKFGEAAHELYRFVWNQFADKYIEETKGKDDQETKDTLAYLLLNSLKLLHPFMPFVTEEIYSKLPLKGKKLLMIENWP